MNIEPATVHYTANHEQSWAALPARLQRFIARQRANARRRRNGQDVINRLQSFGAPLPWGSAGPPRRCSLAGDDKDDLLFLVDWARKRTSGGWPFSSRVPHACGGGAHPVEPVRYTETEVPREVGVMRWLTAPVRFVRTEWRRAAESAGRERALRSRGCEIVDWMIVTPGRAILTADDAVAVAAYAQGIVDAAKDSD